MEKANLYRNLKYHLPVPTENTVCKLNFQNIYHQRMSLIMLRCSWLTICDQTEEAWQDLGPGAGLIQLSVLTLMVDWV